MKGLIKHNIYSMKDKLKLTLTINFTITLVLGIIGTIKPFAHTWLPVLVLAEIASFAIQSVSTLQMDFKSKWNRFEITMPIRRKDIVKARYLYFVLYGLTGIGAALLTVVVFFFLQASINVERVFFSLTFGAVLLLMVPALMHPLLLILGIDKVETVLTISMAIATTLYLGSATVFNYLVINLTASDLIFRVLIIFVSSILFILSYAISVQLYKKKEL